MTTPLTLTWTSDEDGTYVVLVDGVSVTTGSCVAGTSVVNVIDEDQFFVGENPVTVTVTNSSGVGFDIVDVARLTGPTSPGLCWSAPLIELPREEFYADPLANRLSRHMRQPFQAADLFILASGKVVQYVTDVFDPPRLSLFGAVPDQHVTPDDAALLTAAGFGSNLVLCPSSAGLGFGLDPFGTSPFGG